MTSVEGKVYLYGGFSNDRLREFKRIDPGSYLMNWEDLEVDERFMPERRFYHSMSVYKHYLVLFGGGGNYI